MRALRARPRSWWLDQDRLDVLLAVVLASQAVVSTAASRAPVLAGGRPLDALGILLLLLQTLPVAVRRRNPPRVLAATGISIVVYGWLGYPGSGGALGVLVAFYTVATHSPRRVAIPLAAITAVGLAVTLLSFTAHGGRITQDDIVSNVIVFATVWIFGDNIRVRREYTAELEARASGLEREREERARLAVAEERARIARELHDVVAHSVSVIVVQAAAAQRVLDADPALAREALGSIETSGRSALGEMRRMLGVLRADDRREDALSPQPGIGQVERLVAQMREAGLATELSVEGWPRSLERGVDLTAYRIVQEALTNTLKHAGASATARVTLRYLPEELQIDVHDNGRGAAAGLKGSGAGQGLIGMRERATLYGGTLEVGPVISGGWRVVARLPLDGVDGLATRADPSAGGPTVSPAEAILAGTSPDAPAMLTVEHAADPAPESEP